MSDTPDSPPWVCPDHPQAQIRHLWDRTRAEVNWGPYRPRQYLYETDTNHSYECAVCKRKLAPPTEATEGRPMTAEEMIREADEAAQRQVRVQEESWDSVRIAVWSVKFTDPTLETDP